ncbi:MAG: hypothetical protein PWQ82_1836 [Thermosediminibacterales bacterium]|nr:hypothetical protein [Thermosediminibacterales bacterium]
MKVIKLNKAILEQVIKEKDWSLRQCAKEMGIDPAYLSRVLNNEPGIGIGNKFIAGALKVCNKASFDELFFLEDTVDKNLTKRTKRKEQNTA